MWSYCKPPFPTVSFFCVHGSTGIGGANLKSPVGGFPYGIPKYASTFLACFPYETFLPKIGIIN